MSGDVITREIQVVS